jgi:hypothetical protein
MEWAWAQRGVVAVQSYPDPTFITLHVKDADAYSRLEALLRDSQFKIHGIEVKLASPPGRTPRARW